MFKNAVSDIVSLLVLSLESDYTQKCGSHSENPSVIDEYNIYQC